MRSVSEAVEGRSLQDQLASDHLLAMLAKGEEAMSLERDWDAIVSTVTQEPWASLSAWADVSEDMNEPWLAMGLRWLATQQKFPAQRTPGKYLWWIEGRSDFQQNRLPRAVIKTLLQLHNPVHGYEKGEFQTTGEAFRLAALAYAVLAREEYEAHERQRKLGESRKSQAELFERQ